MGKTTRIILKSIRWTSFILGLLLLALYLVFAIGEGAPPFFRISLESLMAWCLFTWCIAVLISLKWPGAGALFGLSGIGGFYGLNYLGSGRFPGGPFFFLMWIPPLLFLLVWYADKRQAAAKPLEKT